MLREWIAQGAKSMDNESGKKIIGKQWTPKRCKEAQLFLYIVTVAR